MTTRIRTTTDTTDADFARDVLDSAVPVLVDFWAEWCAPCHQIAPVLEQLAAERAGTLRVVKLNSDEHPVTAARYRVLGLPTLHPVPRRRTAARGARRTHQGHPREGPRQRARLTRPQDQANSSCIRRMPSSSGVVAQRVGETQVAARAECLTRDDRDLDLVEDEVGEFERGRSGSRRATSRPSRPRTSG